MLQETKSIEFFGEFDLLSNVSMEQVKGGLELSSYSGGCPENDHQTVDPIASLVLS